MGFFPKPYCIPFKISVSSTLQRVISQIKVVQIPGESVDLIGMNLEAPELKQNHLATCAKNCKQTKAMAAVLKKRAISQLSQVIIEELPQAPKRIRIIKKAASHSDFDVELLKSSSSTDVLQVLLQLSDALKVEVNIQAQYRTLLDHFQKEHESAVRVKLVSLLCEMVQANQVEPPVLFDDLQSLLKWELSHKVIAQILQSLHCIGKIMEPDKRVQQRLLTVAQPYLSDTTHKVKCKVLSIIGDCSTVEDEGNLSSGSTLSLLANYTHSHEPRVRTEALNALLNLHNRGLKLDASLYTVICEALTDDYKYVKMAALKLLEVISHIHAENLVCVTSSEEKIRLADDAFAKICHMITDLSTDVRVLAASLLGNIKEVSIGFLEQTLDKKLMSNLRKKKTAHERQKKLYEAGEWSTGKKWANDSRGKEELDVESVNLMSSGACGAFVHGLEDEFLEVRNATLDSLCTLAVEFPSFALMSLDFLVDMFNDEIEEVRLKAVHCLQKISKHIMLREDQLSTMLGVLEDFSMDLREAMHEMLGLCQLSTKECLKLCIDHLLENLKRYPQDKRSIWRCLQKLGSKHPYLTLPLVPELLSIHPFIDMTEQNIEDPAYICSLILVFNAVVHCPVMKSLFDEFTLKHYSYLKDTLPQLVPQLQLTHKTSEPSNLELSDDESRKFLHTVLERVAAAEHRSSIARQRLLETSIQDLKLLSTIEPKLSAAANCAAFYVQCQLLLAKIISNKNWLNPSLLSPLQCGALKSSLEQLLQLSFCMSHQFLGLNTEEILCLRQLRLRALALQLMVLIKGSNTSALGPCEAFLEQVDSLQRYQEENNLHGDNFTTALFRELYSLDDPKPGTVARILQPLLQCSPCQPLRLHTESDGGLQRIKQASAVIHEPAGDSDTLHKFTAGLILGVTMDAEIENIEDIKNVKVKVKYPDQQVLLILPRLADFRQQGDLQYRLYTTVLLSHNVWSEACHVNVSLVLDFSETEANFRGSQRNSPWLKADENTIELCKPVKVCIAPKPAKKGI